MARGWQEGHSISMGRASGAFGGRWGAAEQGEEEEHLDREQGNLQASRAEGQERVWREEVEEGRVLEDQRDKGRLVKRGTGREERESNLMDNKALQTLIN